MSCCTSPLAVWPTCWLLPSFASHKLAAFPSDVVLCACSLEEDEEEMINWLKEPENKKLIDEPDAVSASKTWHLDVGEGGPRKMV